MGYSADLLPSLGSWSHGNPSALGRLALWCSASRDLMCALDESTRKSRQIAAASPLETDGALAAPLQGYGSDTPIILHGGLQFGDHGDSIALG
jgi:hypothetical protein